MNAELIAVGTELLLGQTLNTDAQMLAVELSGLGINVYVQTVVGDNPGRLMDAIQLAKSRADILITTGGLGPTCDDLTKETLARAFGRKLTLHEPSLARIRAYYEKLGRTMPQNNEKQAYLPEGCTVFPNDWGTAPGCGFTADGFHVLMLPGPPRECTPMFRQYGRAFLQALSDSVIVSRQVRVFGLGESRMEEMLRDLMEQSENPTLAPYAKEGECLVRLTAKAETEEQARAMLEPAEEEVLHRLGEYVYGVDVDSLEQVVAEGLRARGLTLATAESCTGGLLAKRLTDLPGVSACYRGGVVSYVNEIKQELLGVSEQTLAQYGAVSPQTAEEMARGAAQRLGTDVGVGITGVAGPEESEGKPVGLVYVAVYYAGQVYAATLSGGNRRDRVRTMAASQALDLIRRRVLAQGLDKGEIIAALQR